MDYQINEAIFDIPETWKDRSINVFSSSDSLPSDYSLVITRDEFEEENLDSFVKRQIIKLTKEFPHFKLRNRKEIMVADVPAIEIESSWSGDVGSMIQFQVFFSYNQKPIIITATSRGRLAENNRKILENIISTFRFRKSG